MIKLIQGDCLDVMKGMEDNSISSIVTDPPYGISFMGKKWDYDVPSVEIWEECLRVLKPGGTALIFAGSRTQHRMAVNVEDAGFILKDTIMWIYGSGFPKSLDISKALDKVAGAERKITGIEPRLVNPRSMTPQGKNKRTCDPSVKRDNPSTPEAKQWNGQGTAIKPAYEPIIIAMKPNDGTYANNALKHGVAGINIDGCRIPGIKPQVVQGINTNKSSFNVTSKRQISGDPNEVRFPANIIHDGSDEVLELFPNTKSGAIKAGQPAGTDHTAGDISHNRKGGRPAQPKSIPGSVGSAARFFYCAKASKKERGEGNYHPTVKPLALIEYLCKLVKQPTPNAITLDPFMGSNTTGLACNNLGIDFIGIERDPEYFKIAEQRISGYVPDEIEYEDPDQIQMTF